MSGFAASPAQREKVKHGNCCACGAPNPDPAHLIPRGMTTIGQDDPRAVIPLCRSDHRAYDLGTFDLLPFLEPLYRTELAYAVQRVGFMQTYRQVTGQALREAA